MRDMLSATSEIVWAVHYQSIAWKLLQLTPEERSGLLPNVKCVALKMQLICSLHNALWFLPD